MGFKKRLSYLGADGWNTDGTTGNNPYYLQKLTPSANNSSLRLTINDDDDESFQIWGNACGTTGCGGEGAMQHKFRADSTAAHSGSMVLGYPNTAEACMPVLTANTLHNQFSACWARASHYTTT